MAALLAPPGTMTAIPPVSAVMLAAVSPTAFLGFGFVSTVNQNQHAGAAEEHRAKKREDGASAGPPGGDQTGQCGELLVIHASAPFRAVSGAWPYGSDMMNTSGAES
jgi:hypothetical protein